MDVDPNSKASLWAGWRGKSLVGGVILLGLDAIGPAVVKNTADQLVRYGFSVASEMWRTQERKSAPIETGSIPKSDEESDRQKKRDAYTVCLEANDTSRRYANSRVEDAKKDHARCIAEFRPEGLVFDRDRAAQLRCAPLDVVLKRRVEEAVAAVPRRCKKPE